MSIEKQKLMPNVNIQIAVVDDASIDGTCDAIRKYLPYVKIIRSTGDLYWAGAMRYGFSQLWNPNVYSYLLVFNDDCDIYPNAISDLIIIAEKSIINGYGNVVVVSSMQEEKSGEWTYGGLRKKKYLPAIYLEPVLPNYCEQIIDSFNMNLVLISKECLDKNEFIPDYFTHGYADYDFGLRISRNKSKIILAPGYQGTCSRNDIKNTWLDINISFRKRWFLIQQPKGLPFRQRYKYLKYHAPYAWPLIFIWPYMKYPVLHVIDRAIKILKIALQMVECKFRNKKNII